MMPTCKTCRHWSETDRVGFGRCGGIPMGRDKLVEPDYVETVFVNDDTDELIPPDGAAAMDGSGYFAAIITGPDFGCTLHEEKS